MEEEFRDFVTARSAALLRTAYLLAGDWSTAEDLLQTALTKTYLAWKRLGQIEAVEPYARRVLVNTATSWWRRRWHGERPTEFLPERAAPDNLEEQLDRDVLWKHVKALPTRQRAVLVLRFYEDMSEAQTAAMLQISPGTVKSQTSRALGTLRQKLAAEGVTGRLPAIAEAAPRVAARPVPDMVVPELVPGLLAGGTTDAATVPVPAQPVPVVPAPRREAAGPARVPVGRSGR
ncbi:SigE family RNA polymerase sigma factor [Catellatospora sp. KI3]|uniref:SigE family RNA polymerase sigma factor n=1 Tax=Catellatospora sp. KI3 TaxID=3041620 RepID=UPI0024825AC5|nr:SigE family RNA polymerase sigma factor [Catellatospora sp. KI3]MDI1460032.1 SigE family RNA polymerase sigma factor [Catellatospora sp. KI3]